MDPENESLVGYKGGQIMCCHPWDVPAYPESRFNPDGPPNMIYLPSVDLVQKMILASGQNKSGKIINDANDILERFISSNL